MNFAFYIEATDMPRSHLVLTHPFQPHLLRFVGVTFDDMGREIDRLFTLVKTASPTLLSIEAHDVHSVLLERAAAEGREPIEVFRWFIANADSAKRIVGHNVLFDIRIMQILGARLTGQFWEPRCPLFSTIT